MNERMLVRVTLEHWLVGLLRGEIVGGYLQIASSQLVQMWPALSLKVWVSL